MARKIKPKVKVPRKAKKGKILQIKTALKHPIETGWRKDKDGKTVPKNRIEKFVCKFAGKEVFSADFFSGVSANPYLVFHAKATGSGTFDFLWLEDTGKEIKAKKKIKVS